MTKNKLGWLLPLLCLAACGNANRRGNFETVKADAVPAAAAADSAGVTTTPGYRKIIREADVRGRSANTIQAVAQIERLVRASGGTVEESHTERVYGETTTFYYKADSQKQAQAYTITANMTLRVPARRLDSVMEQLPALISVVDSRTLAQKDITSRYVANELKNEPPPAGSIRKEEARNKVEQWKYEDTRREQAIDRLAENMDLDDKVQFATLTVSLTQPEQYLQQVIANTGVLTGNTAGLKLYAAINNGADLLLALLLALVSIWPLLVAGPLLWAGFRKLRRLKAVAPSK